MNLFSLLLSPYFRYFIIAALVLVGILLLAGIGGIIYGIYEAVRTRRRPCLYSLIAWGIALLCLIPLFVIEPKVANGTFQVFFLGRFWDFWQTFLFGVVGLSFFTGSCVFVFLAFLRNDREKKREAEVEAAEEADEELEEKAELNADIGRETVGTDRPDVMTKDNVSDTVNGDDRASAGKKRKRTTNLLPEILTFAVTVVLVMVLAIFLKFWSWLSDDHMVSELTSPDGQYEIIVDNASWLGFESARVYERRNFFLVKRLPEANGTSVEHIDVNQETVEWTDEGVFFPFGYTYYQYNFSDTESE